MWRRGLVIALSTLIAIAIVSVLLSANAILRNTLGETVTPLNCEQLVARLLPSAAA